MTWTFDRRTQQLTNSEGHNEFTATEFDRQVWPACEICGSTLHVQAIRTPNALAEDTFIPGRITCLTGCDLRRDAPPDQPR